MDVRHYFAGNREVGVDGDARHAREGQALTHVHTDLGVGARLDQPVDDLKKLVALHRGPLRWHTSEGTQQARCVPQSKVSSPFSSTVTVTAVRRRAPSRWA